MSMLDGGFSPGGTSRNRPHSNLTVLKVAVVALFAVLTLRLVDMQIVNGKQYADRSLNNHIVQTNILPPRGLVTDRNGVELVQNVPVYTAVITPELLPESEAARYAIYLKLEQPDLTGVPALQIQAMVQAAENEDRADQEIRLKKYLTKGQALTLEEASVDMPGVSLEIKPGRAYVGGEAFSHILGYIGEQTKEDGTRWSSKGYLLNEPVGRTGLEARYEGDLRGRAGISANEQDAHGRLIEVLQTEDPVPGNTLKLAIDANLQNFVAELLKDSRQESQNAAVVVMNAKTGEIYSLVTLPTYDNNLFVQPTDEAAQEIERLMNDPRKPFLNWALNPAAPGSTFKIVTASAALQEGLITPATGRTVNSTILEVKGETGDIYHLVDWAAHGYVNLYSAIAKSSNHYFFQASCGILGETLGLSKKSGDTYSDSAILGKYARSFGYGKSTGIDLDGESPGLVPTVEWKKRTIGEDWYYADTCFMGIGQGDMLATPLQVARMTAAVANGGKLVTPHVVNDIVSPDGTTIRKVQPRAETVDVDPKYLADIRQGMHESVIYGAGHRAAIPGLDIAGKTGTAEFKDYAAGGVTRQHAWFTGFYPFEDPEIVVTVYFDLGIGGDKAAPVAGKIFQYFAENVQP